MTLLLELHGDLPDDFPDDERRLYIFACSRKACARKPGCIRALRATRKVKIEPIPQKQQQTEENQEKPEIENKEPAPKQDLGASLFGAGALTGNISANANPFSSSSQTGNNSSTSNNPFATPSPGPSQTTANNLSETFADKVRISAPETQLPSTNPPSNFTPLDPPEKSTTSPTPWPPQTAFQPAYPHYYLDAEHETLSRPSTPTIPENVTIDAADDPNAGGSAAELKDTFESELDKAFLRFSTRLAHNPEQVLRYEFRGEPLLCSYGDEVGKKLHPQQQQQGQNNGHVTTTNTATAGVSGRIPRCEYCGSQRVFELQLVPHAISMLEEGREKLKLDPKDNADMEWGTIIVGVCGKDCAPDEVGVVGWREEWAGVQWEE